MSARIEVLPQTFKFTCASQKHSVEYTAVLHEDDFYHISWSDGQCYEKSETILSCMNRTDDVKWQIVPDKELMVNVKHFVEESEMVHAVAKLLGISHSESENLYCALGGYSGNGPVNFSTRWPDSDQFSVAVQDFMRSKGIESLMVGYDD